MPIYEFICENCRKRMSFLIRDTSAPFVPECSSCGNANLSRVISGFAHQSSLKTVWEESGKPTTHPSDDYYTDPRNIGRWVEKKFQAEAEAIVSRAFQEAESAPPSPPEAIFKSIFAELTPALKEQMDDYLAFIKEKES